MKLFDSLHKDKQTVLVVNGYNATNGGGLRIFQGLISYLGGLSQEGVCTQPIIIFSPRHVDLFIEKAYKLGMNVIVYSPTGIQLIDQILLYYFYLPIRAFLAQKSECLLNLGDLIVPCVSRQIYYLDWPYAIQEAKDIWQKMNFIQRIYRLSKLSNIKIFVNVPRVMIVQSQFVANKMTLALGRTSSVVIPCPVEKPKVLQEYDHPGIISNNKGIYQFLCLSSFAPHKNIEILLSVANVLKMRGIQIRIVLTLDSRLPNVNAFLKKIYQSKLSSYLRNVGPLSFDKVEDYFDCSDALLLPTKLETFGIPYVESLARGKPILTSDLPFAHEVCKTGTLFFDPSDPNDIANVIQKFIQNPRIEFDQSIVDRLVTECRPSNVYAEILDQVKFHDK